MRLNTAVREGMTDGEAVAVRSSITFFSEGYLPTHRTPQIMPSKYMVSVSLDFETMQAWETLPVGERSKRIREALRTADLVLRRDLSIKKRDHEILELKKEIADMKLFLAEHRRVIECWRVDK